jgi:hypothetical protein
MKIYHSLILCLWLPIISAPSHLRAENDSLPAYNTLRTPISPAFTLLGVAPTNVERPNTPKDFAISLLNRTNNFSTLPKDFAIEISPYWMLAGSRDEWRKDSTRTIGQSILKTGTLSFATAQIGNDTNQNITGMAAGFRCLLSSGTLASSSVQILLSIEQNLTEELVLISQMDSTARAINDQWLIQQKILLDATLKQKNDSSYDSALEEAMRQHSQRKKTIADSLQASPTFLGKVKPIRDRRNVMLQTLQETASIREGVFWELSGAAVWSVPNGIIDKGAFDRFGFWTTVSYQWQSLSLIGVGRYIGTLGGASVSSTLDVGARGIYTKDKYAISVESVFRKLISSAAVPFQWRVVGGVDYLIAPNTWAVVSFGRDFNAQTQGSLIAQLGLSFHVGNDRFTLPTGQPNTSSE